MIEPKSLEEAHVYEKMAYIMANYPRSEWIKIIQDNTEYINEDQEYRSSDIKFKDDDEWSYSLLLEELDPSFQFKGNIGDFILNKFNNDVWMIYALPMLDQRYDKSKDFNWYCQCNTFGCNIYVVVSVSESTGITYCSEINSSSFEVLDINDSRITEFMKYSREQLLSNNKLFFHRHNLWKESAEATWL